jgi:hypothetical protein
MKTENNCLFIFFTLIFFSIVTNSILSGDNGTYLKYALKVKDFDTTGCVITKGSDGEINIKNSAGNILRFRVNDKDNLLAYHCGIVFIYYGFSGGWINRYKTLDKDGVLKGDDEFEDLAVVEYEIKKMNLLHTKFEVLNEADGNIPMNDAKDEIVYMKAYDSKNKLIKENYISSKEYWMANNVMYRP